MSHRRVLSFLTLLILPLLLPVSAAAQPPAVVTGVVIDGITTEPLPGATVDSSAQTATTDAAGRFTVTLAPGTQPSGSRRTVIWRPPSRWSQP